MTVDQFWTIVEKAHAASGDDLKAKCRLLAEELRRLFDEINAASPRPAPPLSRGGAGVCLAGG